MIDTRNRILTKATELYARQGIKNVTMDQLALHLGMSKRTIYEYFKDKDEIVFQGLLKGFNQQEEKIGKVIKEAPNVIEAIYNIGRLNHEMMNGINPVFFEDLKKYYKNIFELLIEKGGMSYSDQMRFILRKGLKEGVFRKELNLDLVNLTFQKLMELFHTEEYVLLEKYSKIEIHNSIMKPYLVGICTNKGLEYLKNLDNILDE